MATKLSPVEQVTETYGLRDPEQTTALIGRGAILLHLHDRDVDTSELFTVADVDTLGTLEAARYIARVAELDQARMSQMPQVTSLGIETLGVQVFPDPEQAAKGILPFSTSSLISDAHYAMDYTTLHARGLIEEVGDSKIPAISFVAMLQWMARVGRAKDNKLILDLLPVAKRSGLVTPAQALDIEILRISAAAEVRLVPSKSGYYPVDPPYLGERI